MPYKVIELPGVMPEPNRTTWAHAYFESLTTLGRQDEPIRLILQVKNWNKAVENHVPYFAVEFSGVFEYRFIASFAFYEDIALHEEDYTFGLIEIFDSAYVENMAAKGSRRNLPVGQRFGKYDNDPASGGIFESDVRHFRFAQDEWGKLDVIAVGIEIKEAYSG